MHQTILRRTQNMRQKSRQEMCGAGATNPTSSNSLQGQKVSWILDIEFFNYGLCCSLDFVNSCLTMIYCLIFILNLKTNFKNNEKILNQSLNLFNTQSPKYFPRLPPLTVRWGRGDVISGSSPPWLTASVGIQRPYRGPNTRGRRSRNSGLCLIYQRGACVVQLCLCHSDHS